MECSSPQSLLRGGGAYPVAGSGGVFRMSCTLCSEFLNDVDDPPIPTAPR